MTAYRLLKPGPHPVDELRGDVDLFEAHNLSRIANAVLGGALKHGDYLRGMTGATEFRKGPNLLLAPLAVHAGSHQELSLPPLPRESLVEGCHLSTEHFELTEAEKGIPVVSAMGGPTSSTGTQNTARKKKEKKRKRAGEPSS